MRFNRELRVGKFQTPEMDKRYFIGSLIGGLASLGGSIIGKSGQDSALDAAEQRQIASLRYLDDMPEYEYLQGTNPMLEASPEQLQAQMISEDPALRSTEVAALQKMQELADKGLSAQDAYNYMQAEQRAGQESRGQQEAIINEMQRKGMGGSGLEYALRNRVSQDAVDRFAENQAMQAAKIAEQKALANLQQSNMAGNIRGEDYRVNNANTNALNEFAQQNLRNRMEVGNRNINRQNIFSSGETAERRNIANQNVAGARNVANQKANLRQGLSAYDLARGVGNSNMTNDIFNTIGKMGGNIYDHYNKPKGEQ